ncbi:MAG: ammonium transporter [bacterium]|nr:ammonium transporter [bacterium]
MNDHTLMDVLWVLVASGLVFVMQAGFALLESGFTRSKNSINVAMKNMTDLGLSVILYWVSGFGIMFGVSYQGWFGTSGFLFETGADVWQTTFFLFQAMFCATAATIVSGASAERMRYGSYLFVTLITSGVVYPVLGHWIWNEGGWLNEMGFVDFAGSTVVHSVGGWVGLAAILQMGARGGRFRDDGSVMDISGSNIPMAILGALLLWFGWFGFNGGSTLAMDLSVAKIIANTVLAGAAGAMSALAIGWPLKRVAEVGLVINGSLAGLVAITAGCHAVSSGGAVFIGAVGGVIMFGVEELFEKLKIDDAVGAFPVHTAAGIWGTLAVALLGDPATLGTGLGFWAQLQAQATGVLVTFAWAFGVGYILLWIINRMIPLRVTAEDEKMGLNVAEHGASTELMDLFQAMETQAETGDLSVRVPVEPFTEVGQIASRYNSVMGNLESTLKERDAIFENVDEGLFLLDPDLQFGAQYSAALPRIFLREDLEGRRFIDLFRQSCSEEIVQAIKDYLDLMLQADMDLAWVADLNPLNEMEIHIDDTVKGATTRILSCKFSRIYDQGRITHLMGALKDVTEQVMLARELRESKETSRQQMERLFSVLHVEPAALAEFIVESNGELERINEILRIDDPTQTLQQKLEAIYRAMHTIKGNAAILDLGFLADQAHAFEEKLNQILNQSEIQRSEFFPLIFMISELRALLDELDGLSQRLIEYSQAAEASRDTFIRTVESMIERLGPELGKSVTLDAQQFEGDRIPGEHRKALKDILVQLVRNSLSHGIESPAEREAANKPAVGTIRLITRILDDSLQLAVKDDGRGLAIEKLREMALESGRWSPEEIAGWSEAQIAKLIYMPGLSTAEEVSHLSGRGVGMDIIKQSIHDLGGKIRTSFSPGKFTEFSIQIPLR